MSLLDQPASNEAEIEFHNRNFISNSHGLVKSDPPHFNGLNPLEPNPMPFYHTPVPSNGHTSPSNVNIGRTPLDDKEDLHNGQMSQMQPGGFNCPSPQTPGGKKNFGPDGAAEGQGNGGQNVVYPWMKRIHVSHGELILYELNVVLNKGRLKSNAFK